MREFIVPLLVVWSWIMSAMSNIKRRFFISVLLCCSFLSADKISDSRRNAITRAIEKVGPAVASINVIQDVVVPFGGDPWFNYFFPEMFYRKRKARSSGSGVVISPDGYIITNSHVVENASEVFVSLQGGKEFAAEIIGIDHISDVALLKLDGRDFPYASLSNSDDLIIGEWVIALGNPLGLFEINNQPTATVGIISAVDMNFGEMEGGQVYKDMIQTDAAINMGNSGGPLVNSEGKVIGINTFIYTGSSYSEGSIGIGFAIPINRAKRIVEELKNTGRVDRSYKTGLTVQPLTPRIALYMELSISEGLIVIEVEDNSTADRSDIKDGDIITKVNGVKVKTTNEFRVIIEESDLRQGDRIKIQIYRNGRYLNKILALGKAGP